MLSSRGLSIGKWTRNNEECSCRYGGATSVFLYRAPPCVFDANLNSALEQSFHRQVTRA